MATTKKIGRPAGGQVKWTRNVRTGQTQWHARFTVKGKRTKFAPLDPSIPEQEEGRARECARAAHEYLVNGGAVSAMTGETVEQYAQRWLKEREGRVNSIRDDRGRLRLHVLPVLGRLEVAKFDRDDVERLRDALDRKIVKGALSWKTAANCWSLATSMADDMVNSKCRDLRVRTDNPTEKVRAPERGNEKAKQYLYPSEFLQFVSYEKIPLRWRRAVALAVYTYTRDGELRVLRWNGGDLDLDHGVLSITRAYNRRTKTVKATKTGHTRRFAVEPHLLPLLRVMHEEKLGEGGLVIALPSERAMARNLRRWLWKAGVRRPELHEGSPTRKQLTWHDLRATGATWMAVRGDEPLKIKQRCGHKTFSTTEIYIREAEAVREGFGEPFPALPETLLSLGRVSEISLSKIENNNENAYLERGGRDSNPRPPA
jgi:integrase